MACPLVAGAGALVSDSSGKVPGLTLPPGSRLDLFRAAPSFFAQAELLGSSGKLVFAVL